jgi:hypothetical protein
LRAQHILLAASACRVRVRAALPSANTCCARAQDYWLSIDRFVNWSDTASGKNDFYTDYKIKQMYKAHLRTFTSRVNTINGRKYSEDPTIYYWNLLNEPRWCAPGSTLTFYPNPAPGSCEPRGPAAACLLCLGAGTKRHAMTQSGMRAG